MAATDLKGPFAFSSQEPRRTSRVVLHIGTHKTATTTIQGVFYDNSEFLAKHGLIYPKLGPVKGHHGLVCNWDNLAPNLDLEAGINKNLSDICTRFADQPVTVFLSSEEFSHAGRVDFKVLREKLSAFDEIEVICTLRTQWAFLQSVYLQLSTRRNPMRPPALVKSTLSSSMVGGLWMDYNGILDMLSGAFAPEEITLVDFNSAVRSEGGIVGTYLRHLDVPISVQDLKHGAGRGAVNVSVMPIVGWLANILAEPKPAPKWLIRMVDDVVAEHVDDDTKSCLFTTDEFDQIRDHFAPLNEKLHSRRAAVQPDFQLTPPDRDSVQIFRDTLPTQVLVKVAKRQTRRLMAT